MLQKWKEITTNKTPKKSNSVTGKEKWFVYLLNLCGIAQDTTSIKLTDCIDGGNLTSRNQNGDITLMTYREAIDIYLLFHRAIN